MNTMNSSNNRNLFAASLNAVPASQVRDGDTDWFPAVDVSEARQEYVFEVDLPGLKPQEIQLHVDSEGLSISGQRLPRHRGGKRVRVGRPSGAFVRLLPLPPDAHGEIHAIFGDGVLELHVPKARPDSDPGQAQAMAREPVEATP
jgi:HSP20 family protein